MHAREQSMQNKTLDLRTPLVIGCGVSGRAAARFLQAQGSSVTIAEKSLTQVTHEGPQWQREGITLLHEEDVSSLNAYSLIVISPGLPQEHALIREAQQRGLPVIGEMELGLRFLQGRAIGITGTNGKTSVTLLTHHVLSQSGIACHAVGNVGVPLTEKLLTLTHAQAAQDLFIIEMSSFQLEDLQLPCLEQAIILNLTANHIDRHGTMEAYARAKCSISSCIKPEGVLFAHPQALQEYGSFLQHSHIKPLHVHENPRIENAESAFALCNRYGIDIECFTQRAASWKPPSHRMAFVREKEGVRYYNDSKASNLAAVEKAVQCLPGPILLLAGGVHKGASYRPWVDAFKGKVRQLFLFGQAALQIEAELGMFFPVTQASCLQEALHKAASMAHSGETILLAPGCSSYDMFRDYIHRGESFEKWVKEL